MASGIAAARLEVCMSSNHTDVKNGGRLVDVWKEFVLLIEQHLDGGKKTGMLVAWGGKSCDCKWMFKVCEEQHPGVLNYPKHCPYFLDPKVTINHHTS